MNLIADEKILYRSAFPDELFCYTPALCAGFDGRIVASIDLGGAGTARLDGPKSSGGDAASGNQVRVFYSDDHGHSWTESPARLAMLHENLFRAGKSLYMIGQSGALLISRSDDNAVTWSVPVPLDTRFRWKDGAGRVNVDRGRVTACYGRAFESGPWAMPVAFCANENADLTVKENWTFSEPFDPRPLLESARTGGLPMVEFPGIIEPNVTKIYDPGHEYFDHVGQRSVVFFRTTWERPVPGMANVAAVLTVTDDDVRGKVEIQQLQNAGGRNLFHIPWPGGSVKFNLVFDPVDSCYWMAASQIDGRGSPRRRLALYFSGNLFDWCFAGMVAAGKNIDQARNYPALLLDGDDLIILSRSGDEAACSDHDSNLITVHRVARFRSLRY
ncbi:MAG: sialidase family protein [Victivallaceae bacterium]|nr:sialidase family protein [Victivallaceae bacterium]